jgi:hypothetical protein
MATRYYDHRAMVSLTAEQADKVESVRHRFKLKSASHAIRVMILAYEQWNVPQPGPKARATDHEILRGIEPPAPETVGRVVFSPDDEPKPLDDELDTRLILGARKVMSHAIRVTNSLAPGRPNPKTGRKK